MSKYLEFRNLLKKVDDDFDGDEYLKIRDQLKEVVLKSSDADTFRILQDATALEDNHIIKRWVYKLLSDVYYQKPFLRKKVLEVLSSDYALKELGAFYQNAAQIASVAYDENEIDFCLDQIEAKLGLSCNTSSTLKTAYHELGRLFGHKNIDRYRIIRLIENGLDHPNKDEKSSKAGERVLYLKENLKSSAVIGERVPKIIQNPFGFNRIDEVPPDRPCIFILPGNGTTRQQILNGYFSDVQDLLSFRGLSDKVSIYGAFYQFGDYANPDKAIINQMKMYNRLKGKISDTEKENIDPKYIEDIFSKAVLNRVQDKNGRRLDFETARCYIRNINFLNHCHGSLVFLQLEEKLQNKMKELGYNSVEQNILLDNFFCASFAPFAPIGVNKAKKISFLSATDESIRHFNQAEKSIRKLAENGKLPPCYLSGKRGDVFIVSALSMYGNEHDWGGFGKRQKYLSKEGKMLNQLLESVVIGAVKSSIKHKNLRGVRDLIEQGAETPEAVKIFDIFEENGKQVWQDIKDDIKTRMLQKRLLDKRQK